MNWFKAVKGFTLSLIFLSLVFFSIQGMWSFSQKENIFLGSVSEGVIEEKSKILPITAQKKPSPQRDWQVPELNVEAETGIIAEISFSQEDKILFKKNTEKILPIASLTKLMTAVVSIENYNLSDMIVVGQNSVSQDGSHAPLNLKDTMSVNDLLHLILIESSNQAAFALSEGMGLSLTQNQEGSGSQKFVDLMNKKAKEIGMRKTFFKEPTGLSAENTSSAEDLVKLSKYILKNHPEIIRISKIIEIDLPGYGKLNNTNQLLAENPDIVGGKTGFTIDANGCLLLIINNLKSDDYLIYIVLGANDRFLEIKRMIDWANVAYSWQ